MKEDLLIAGCAIGIVAVIWLGLWAIIEDGKAWEAFTAEHVCERTQQQRPGYYITTFINNMPILTWVPGKVLYQCDDGKGYWRAQ